MDEIIERPHLHLNLQIQVQVNYRMAHDSQLQCANGTKVMHIGKRNLNYER